MTPQLLEHYNQFFDEIFIHPDAENAEVTGRFKKFFPEKIKAYRFFERPSGNMSPSDFDLSKRRVLIQPYKGKFFKQCPGGNSKSACCNYFVLNLGSQCHFNCSYCYLQSFLNFPYLSVYSNIEDALDELKNLSRSKHSFRLGTGEVIDSLGLDPITQYSSKIINLIKDYKNITLELKTKSNFVDHLLDLNSDNTVISWSINPNFIIQNEEHHTASLYDRLEAAKKSLSAGYKIGFHIDPVIWHDDWKKNYASLVEDITRLFKPSDVPYISLGALRFQPEQKLMMKQRFKRSSLVNQAEMFQGNDGKLRYDSQMRAQMFKFIIDEFKQKDRAWRVFLCMESPETWLSTYGNFPSKIDELNELFTPRPHTA